jgi:hypothetical protein
MSEALLVAVVYSSGENGGMTTWEYLIVALPRFEAPTPLPEHSWAVRALNDEGALGWGAVAMSVLGDGERGRPAQMAIG